jgi:hypothetical protein
MTQLEDRLRDAFQEKAARIPAQPPQLRLEPARLSGTHSAARGLRGAPKPGTRRWAAAAAAIGAIALVAAATAVVAGVFRQPEPRSAADGVPRYYVALAYGSQHSQNLTAVVRATRTGAVIADIAVPRPYMTFANVSGAADDRTFVLEAEGKPRTYMDRVGKDDFRLDYVPERFYLLRLDPAAKQSGQRAKLTALARSIPPALTITDAISLSPDGTQLAVVTSAYVGLANALTVYSLAAGTSRTWTDGVCGLLATCPGIGTGLASPYSGTISWLRGGRSLAVLAGVPDIGFEFRLLNVAARGRNLLADSSGVRLSGAPDARPGQSVLGAGSQWRTAFVTPDGNSAFVGAQFDTYREAMLRFSARTGKLTAIVNELSTGPRRDWEQVLWTSNSGNTQVVTGVALGYNDAGVLHGKNYTPIPWSANITDAAW